jgi:hypothetical protein
MLVTAASPSLVQPAAANAMDVYGSHDFTIFPRPSNTTIASFKPGSNSLEVFYKFNDPNAAGIDYLKYYMDGLPNYQWVDLKINATAEESQEITATASSWLKANGLVSIDVTIANDGITVRADMTGTYVNNECLFYWSKFYTD